MRGPHNIWRLIRTGATLERTGAMKTVLEAMEAPPALRLTARILGWPFKWLGLRGDTTLAPVPRALTALGPAYIKFGQVMSTRPDLVGQELSQQLRFLQDALPPFPLDVAKATISSELERPWDEVFSDLSDPVAAASIAQVHKGHLKTSGEPVAVKVLRPGIERAFYKDIDAFHLAASMIEFLSPASRRLRPRDVIEHFTGVVDGELDLRVEAAAGDEFAANTAGDNGLVVPAINFSLSARRVMTMNWADGLPLGDPNAIAAAGHDLNAIGERVLQLFLSHALRDGFFHADMHQGNLKVAPDGSLIALDFGIMGRIDEYTRRVYAEILYGFIKRDYRRVAEVHFEAGYVPADRSVDEFAQALRSVGEPIFGLDATQVSMGHLLSYLFEVTERFGMQTRTELILLQRTMVVVEGVARSLNPQINIWQVAKPVVESYIKQSIGPIAMGRDLLRTLAILSRFGPKLPALAEQMLINLSQDEPAPEPRNWLAPFFWVALGAGLSAAGVWVSTLF
ncbi:MAG: 2-polyprenylphenol 6-hydroxylase [Brevirhabdus sp.]